jgi:hypothetical protein
MLTKNLMRMGIGFGIKVGARVKGFIAKFHAGFKELLLDSIVLPVFINFEHNR